jgi:hypothetical protein
MQLVAPFLFSGWQNPWCIGNICSDTKLQRLDPVALQLGNEREHCGLGAVNDELTPRFQESASSFDPGLRRGPGLGIDDAQGMMEVPR